MPRIAIINQKGGVGKTTTTANLGAGLALFGRRVLLIDLDPQANLTSHLEMEPFDTPMSSYELLRDKRTVAELALPTAIPNLSLIPSGGDLAAAEVELTAEFGRETILRKQLDRAESAGDHYDYILIDCPPSLGLLAVNALTAADEAFVPIQAEFFALAGIAKFVELQRLVQDRLNPGLSLAGIVICMWKGHANLSHEVREDVEHTFGDILFETLIRQNVKLAEAPSQGRTIFEYAPESNGAADYEALTREFMLRHHEDVPDEMPPPSRPTPRQAVREEASAPTSSAPTSSEETRESSSANPSPDEVGLVGNSSVDVVPPDKSVGEPHPNGATAEAPPADARPADATAPPPNSPGELDGPSLEVSVLTDHDDRDEFSHMEPPVATWTWFDEPPIALSPPPLPRSTAISEEGRKEQRRYSDESGDVDTSRSVSAGGGAG